MNVVAVSGVIEKMDAVDGILLCSPTCFPDITAGTKALVERSGMVAGANGEMIVPGPGYRNIGVGREIGAVEKDEEGMRTMKDPGRNMAWLLKRIRGTG